MQNSPVKRESKIFPVGTLVFLCLECSEILGRP